MSMFAEPVPLREDHAVQQFVLSAYAPGSEILSVRSYRLGYREYPAWVSVRTPSGGVSQCVLKWAPRAELLAREGQVLNILAETDLPAPRVLAGPAPVGGASDSPGLLLMSELPGEPLPWLGTTSLTE